MHIKDDLYSFSQFLCMLPKPGGFLCRRITATKYLNTMVEMELLQKMKIGRKNFYLNEPLFAALRDGVE